MSAQTHRAVALSFAISFALTVAGNTWYQGRWSLRRSPPHAAASTQTLTRRSILPNPPPLEEPTPEAAPVAVSKGPPRIDDNPAGPVTVEAHPVSESLDPVGPQPVPAWIQYSSMESNGGRTALLKNDSSEALHVTVITHSHADNRDSEVEVELPADGQVNLTGAGFSAVHGDRTTLRAPNHTDVVYYPP